MKNLLIISVIAMFGVSAQASEDRGGHCQSPSCAGARVGQFCGGVLVCGAGFFKVKNDEGKQICLRDGSPKDTKCRGGKEVSE